MVITTPGNRVVPLDHGSADRATPGLRAGRLGRLPGREERAAAQKHNGSHRRQPGTRFRLPARGARRWSVRSPDHVPPPHQHPTSPPSHLTTLPPHTLPGPGPAGWRLVYNSGDEDRSAHPTGRPRSPDRTLWKVSGPKIRAIERRYDPAAGAPVFTAGGRYTSRGWTDWTQGFQYGSPLLQFDATGDRRFLEIGRRGTLERMAPHLTHTGVHDHGFNNVSTYGTLWRLALEGRFKALSWEIRFYELALKCSARCRQPAGRRSAATRASSVRSTVRTRSSSTRFGRCAPSRSPITWARCWSRRATAACRCWRGW